MFTSKRKRPSRLYLNHARCHIGFTVTSGGLMKADRLPLHGQEGDYACKYWWHLVVFIMKVNIDHYITYCNILVSKWGKNYNFLFNGHFKRFIWGGENEKPNSIISLHFNTRWRSDTVKTWRTLRHFLCAPDRLHDPCAADCFCCKIYIFVFLVTQIKSDPKSE